MNTLQIVQRLLQEEFELADGQVGTEVKLADLGIDSLSTIEFLFRLEEHFKLDMTEEIAPVETVGDIAAEVDRLSTRKAASGDASK